MRVAYLASRCVQHRVPKIIKKWFRSRRCNHPTPIYNIGALSPRSHLKVTDRPKRALLSYITEPFRLSPDDHRNVQFSNIGIARSIVRVLNELGYTVDLVEYTDTKFVPRRRYDLFIGHGGYNFGHILRSLSGNTVKVYFSTGIYWKEWNHRADKRVNWLEQRRNVHLPYDRWIACSEEYANHSADAIICLGNKYAKESYAQFPCVFNLNNAAYPDGHYNITTKNFAFARQNFLFFAGSGNVHKGLDLLLEAFVQVNAHLYICQSVSPKFYNVYRRELGAYPNIHLKEKIPMRSAQFYDLVNRCAFVIHPSCAEGQPGAVTECMHHGLVPIVSRESNIDTNGYGITLKACLVEEILEVVRDLSQRSPEWCEEMSQRTRKAAVTEFSEADFLRNMKNSIQCIVTHKTQRR